MEYIFTNKSEFVEPIRVLFLCGSSYKDSEEDKRVVLKNYLETDSANKVIILEKYFEFGNNRRKEGFLSYYQANLFNLFSIESLAALTATNVIILHESISTAGELGVFGSNPSLRNRIITLVPERYTIEEEKLSSFLQLAFWSNKAQVITGGIIKYYPETKKVFISDNRATYYTYFTSNTLPSTIRDKISEAIGPKKITNVSLSAEKTHLKYQSKIIHTEKCTYVNFEYDVFKNYIIALLTIPDFRRNLSECKKVFEIIQLFQKTFESILRNTINDSTKKCSDKLRISINRQPDLKLLDAISFMIYVLHSCGLINIENDKKNNLISVHHHKGISDLLKEYSCLVQKFKLMDWGE